MQPLDCSWLGDGALKRLERTPSPGHLLGAESGLLNQWGRIFRERVA
jgi:hypothetical protein